MPIIKSAKKRMKQNKVRQARNYIVRSKLRTHFKKALTLIKNKDAKAAEAVKDAYSIIDTASKKGIIHGNNADRKKSRLARELNAMGGGEKKAAEEKGTAKKATAKKTVAKKTEEKKEDKE